MSRNKVVLVALVVIATAAVVWYTRRSGGGDASTYRFAVVQPGTIQQTVSATGALSAVKTVQVGTQVSGQVAEIHADFNDVVTKGQLLARIDPTLQQQAVADAQAQLEKAQAELLQAQQEYDRNLPLFKQQFISATEFGTVQVNRSVGLADVKSAQVALDKAKQNLSYTNIYAPISGVIIERDVNVGQTVAASLSAPQLFLIAQDLTELQILASVDESDIDEIKEAQPAKFTVQSVPGRTFNGIVQQVRLQSTLTDNVVNYTVVVSVHNSDSKLLPGMTATVLFITGSAANVLVVPNAALRFTPTPAQLAASSLPVPAAARAESSAPEGAVGRGGRSGGGGGRSAAGGSGATGPTTPAAAAAAAAATAGTLWTLDAAKRLKEIPVIVGLTDGQQTEVSGGGLRAGTQVIAGVSLGTTAPAATPSANPLAPAAGGGGGRRGGG